MRYVVSQLVCIFALQALPIVGCTEVTDPTTAPLILNVLSMNEPLVWGGPIEGAQLCQTETANCDRTSPTGRARIELPIGEETSFTLVADGHQSSLVPVVMPASGMQDDFPVRTDKYMEAQLERVMADYPMTDTGAVRVYVFPTFAGATFELEEPVGTAFYADDQGWWNLDRTETTNVGLGGFVDVPPGDEYEIRVGGTAKDCTAWWGWPGDDGNSVTFPIRENYLTYVSLLCPRP
jgi:hypothetical protein